jgi:hypothetical protein
VTASEGASQGGVWNPLALAMGRFNRNNFVSPSSCIFPFYIFPSYIFPYSFSRIYFPVSIFPYLFSRIHFPVSIFPYLFSRLYFPGERFGSDERWHCGEQEIMGQSCADEGPVSVVSLSLRVFLVSCCNFSYVDI